MRIGFGSDIHRLVEGRKLILGGVIVPSNVGELAHSDGDVLYHALSDAILGALALGDIGQYFPDNSEDTANMDSALILKFAYDRMDSMGYEIGNVDINITLEQPKLKDFKYKMRENVAKILKTGLNNVSIKAGTNEGLDDVGHSLAVKVDVVVLIKEK